MRSPSSSQSEENSGSLLDRNERCESSVGIQSIETEAFQLLQLSDQQDRQRDPCRQLKLRMEGVCGIPAGPLKVEPFAHVIQKYTVDFLHDGVKVPVPRIPLCRLMNMPLVRPLQRDSPAIDTLKAEFRKLGYQADTPSFFVQYADMEGEMHTVTDDIRGRWDQCWVRANAEFEAECDRFPVFANFKDKMFSVLDGNHRLLSWMQLSEEFPNDMKYHPRVVCVILECSKDNLIEVEMAMHARNS